MIYTLILTAVFLGGNGMSTSAAIHTEHDYPTQEACNKAYGIAYKQLSTAYRVEGTCLSSNRNKLP